MKKIKGLLCMTAAFCLCLSSVAFASGINSTNSNRVPEYKAPGTVLKFDKNKEITVIKQGDVDKNINTSKYTPTSDLPEITADMTVIYDALGGPVISISKEQAKLEVSMNEFNPNAKVSSIASNTQTGEISWFDIWAEPDTASGQKAADGAAHRNIAFFTRVAVVNNAVPAWNTSVRILDRGPYVTGRILDMSKESFYYCEYLEKGVFNGTITW